MDRMPEPMTIAQLPAEMRPREKLLKHGASALTDTELLALFLRRASRAKTCL
jgi:DNA repair protein RadC